MNIRLVLLGVIAAGSLAACGYTTTERVATGAAIGAGAAAVTENDPLVGAAVGGGLGWAKGRYF
ncbi:hypothetical protein JM664_06495 [Rhodobacteraceae bacterium MCCB 386]|nr:hypothetical protein [Roseitranquillus sediminis]